MSLETEIRDICGNLSSNRANDRKKAAASLKKYLETGKAVPTLLTQNTKRKRGFGWNHVFGDVHTFIIKETEKFETSKTFQTVTAPLCTSLLHLCVTGANNGSAYIKSEKITEACLFILADNRLATAIGDAYLTVLYKHILPKDNYLDYFSPVTWENLLDVCISACFSNTSMLDNVMKLKLVWLIIKKATSYCQFIIPLRDSLSRIGDYLVRSANDNKMQEIEIIIVILETLSTECRLTVCEFIERVLPSIFQSYNQNIDQKTKSSLFRLLEMAVMLHHPQGRTQGTAGSLAHNWDLWNRHLNSILEIVCSEITYKQKQLDFTMKQCPHFSYVAAAIMNQIFQSPGDEDNVTGPSKKQKVSSNTNRCFRDLINELKENNMPWFGIIRSYVNKFGRLVTLEEYATLITVLERSLNNDTIKLNWQDYEDLACLTIDNLISRQDNGLQDHIDHILGLWNSCIRKSGATNPLNKSVHSIMRTMIKLSIINYEHVEPLFILYLEERMPVNDYSLKTLICILNKFYSKCCCPEIKLKCLTWLIHDKITELNPLDVKEILLMLVTDENITLNKSEGETSEQDTLYTTLFDTIDKSILFSEFEGEQKPPVSQKDVLQNKVEVNIKVSSAVHDKLEKILKENIMKLDTRDITTKEYINFLHLILHYFDGIMNYTTISITDVGSINIFGMLDNALKQVYAALKDVLKSNAPIRNKITLVKCVQSILHSNYHAVLNSKVREMIDTDCFHSINKVLATDMANEEVMYEEDDMEMSTRTLRHNCILLFAEYCRKRGCFTNELVGCVLNPDLYDFELNSDVDCAFRSIELLNEPEVEDPPIELTFTLMLDICKLFRNPRASHHLLKLFLQMLEKIWMNANDDTKKNIVIMVKSYLQRCTNNYYPPRTAVLVYECIAKIIQINYERNFEHEYSFKEVLINNISGPIHNMRIYSCYLLKIIGSNFSDSDIKCYMKRLTDIFVTDIPSQNESVLSDESANRTSTLLHGFYSLVQAKPCLVHNVIMKLVELQSEKSLNRSLVKLVLSLLTKEITSNTVETYLSNNIVNVLHYWFMKKKHLDVFPMYLFGFDTIEQFLEKHMKWLIAADILWFKKGEIHSSVKLKCVAEKRNTTVENVVEMCFCNIITLCLPYIVAEKYKVNITNLGTKITGSDANKLFQDTRVLLKAEKWNNLFVENLGELVLMTASNLYDPNNAQEQYNVNIPSGMYTFTYTKEVFLAILEYFGEIVDSDIIYFLCKEQPLAVLHILFKLCSKIFEEKVFEFRVLFLHSYLTFIDTIPLGGPSDIILCNFACVSLLHAIQDTTIKEEVKIFAESLNRVIVKVVIHDISVLQKSVVSKAVSVLTIKKEEGFAAECDSLLTYLSTNVDKRISGDHDEVDFVSTIPVGNVESSLTKNSFKAKLESYSLGLCHTSIETLVNVKNFVKANRQFVNVLCNDLSKKGFSEDCESSVIHRMIFALSNIIKSSSDAKIKIEACNCLAEIGTYDIRTLVTVSPVNTNRIPITPPKQYFANVALKACSDILFNENPTTCNKVIEAISHILKFSDGRKALDSGVIDKNVLSCLSQPNSKTTVRFPVDSTKLNKKYSNADYWVPDNETHSQWVTRITVGFLDILVAPSNYMGPLRELCMTKPAVCSEILSSLIGLILNYTSGVGTIISRQLNKLFEHICDVMLKSTSETTLDHDQKVIVQYLLDVVNFVRVQSQHYETSKASPSKTNNYLKLDYDKVAFVACAADQHLDAIYYGELWAVTRNGGVPPVSPEATSALVGGQEIQEMFRKCFAAIGEDDAMEGCGTAHLLAAGERRAQLARRGAHAAALRLHDAALAAAGPRAPPALRRAAAGALRRAGLHHLALQYTLMHPRDEALDDIRYDCLSYLGDWSNFVDTRELKMKLYEPTCQPTSILKAYRYACLKYCLNIRTSENFAMRLDEPLNGAKVAAAKLCENLNMENCQSVYQVVENLHLFRDIEQYYSVRSGKLSITDFISDWNVEKLPSYNNFSYIESLISQRSVILDHAAQNYDTFMADIATLQLQYAELCLSNEMTQMAQRILTLVKDIDTSGRVPLVESQVHWADGHKDIALAVLHSVVTDPASSVKLSAESIRQYGLWMAECKRENTREIINKYLEKSLELATKARELSTKTKVSYDIAKFADEEYKQVAAYMKSETFENKVKCMKNMKDTAATFRGTQYLLTGEERKAWATNNAFGVIEEEEISNTIIERQNFLILAMRYYLLSLIESDDYNLSIFRVVSLWLENSGLDLESKENGSLADLIHSIPSWKFLTVLPQLAPRLSNDETSFAVNLKAIISRCAVEHPHHTLPMLFSLQNSDQDRCESAGQPAGAAGAGAARAAAAGALLAAQPARRAALAPLLADMQKLCLAIIRFANLVPQKKLQKQDVPTSEPLMKLKDLKSIPVPTDTIAVRKDGNYSNIITFRHFEKYYELVGGINCPKKISCYASDGKKRILLIKGQDDMRQDAMMQQVFNIVNILLEKNPITNRNNLSIRTYKVVPMSRQSGVLEWCEGTMPLGNYLAEAHSRLRPQDMPCATARTKLAECHQMKKSNDIKLQVFNEILRQLKPIFHYFFTENYLDPVTWYERKLAYTRSVAASSMIGHIMGLGDRHVNNILIDKCTAEVIHIDFGIAFDLGKTLRTPETVPFRLTQDIIAGFGCNGVEGVFRRCCEKTLELLRDNQETLLTILEVLLHDPLHSWAVSENKLRENSVQCAEEASVGGLAERALLAVRRKLGGAGVAPPGTAARLLRAAADPANLCRLFPGWQPYL